MKVLDFNGYALDVFYVMLLYSGKYEFLPELYDVLGKEKTLQLMDIFSGTSVKFPSTQEIKSISTEVAIYVRLKRANTSTRRKNMLIDELSSEYSIHPDTVRNIYDRVSKVVEDDLQFKVI